jgi:uncharacterized protein DUF2721
VLEFSDVAVAHAVQLAVAPVFLLTGIGAFVAVMTNRLGRVIDRARVLACASDRVELPSRRQIDSVKYAACERNSENRVVYSWWLDWKG